jgi:hypothetical protein
MLYLACWFYQCTKVVYQNAKYMSRTFLNFFSFCVSRVVRSHGTGEDTHGTEEIKEAAYHGVGEWRKITEGGNAE